MPTRPVNDKDLLEAISKVHRKHVMNKLGVRNVADLVRMAEKFSLHK